jgi:hypothetical protein
VFEQVNDFHKWRAVVTVGRERPGLKRTYEGPTAGPGSVYCVGRQQGRWRGRMTVTESRPGEFVRIKLEFFKPFAATHYG